MNKLQEALKSKISKMHCTVHDKKAEIKTSGDNISFDCCCDSFRQRIKEVMKETTELFVSSELKNIFKGL